MTDLWTDQVYCRILIFITIFQAEKFGDSFVLEGKISEEIKKDIHRAVSGHFILSLIH